MAPVARGPSPKRPDSIPGSVHPAPDVFQRLPYESGSSGVWVARTPGQCEAVSGVSSQRIPGSEGPQRSVALHFAPPRVEFGAQRALTQPDSYGRRWKTSGARAPKWTHRVLTLLHSSEQTSAQEARIAPKSKRRAGRDVPGSCGGRTLRVGPTCRAGLGGEGARGPDPGKQLFRRAVRATT